MPIQPSKLASLLFLSIAIGLPGGSAAAQESTSDRLLRGIVNGVLEEFMPQDYGREYRRDGKRHRDHRRGRGFRGIPAGHYPPPGACRVWFPDRPPGHQPPPGRCNVRVPRGAFLVYG